MFKTAEEEKAIEELREKQLLSLYRKVLTRLSKLNLKYLRVEARSCFGDNKLRFSITVFNASNNNEHFCFYSFRDLSVSEKHVDEVILAIKTDDFQKIVALSGRELQPTEPTS